MEVEAVRPHHIGLDLNEEPPAVEDDAPPVDNSEAGDTTATDPPGAIPQTPTDPSIPLPKHTDAPAAATPGEGAETDAPAAPVEDSDAPAAPPAKSDAADQADVPPEVAADSQADPAETAEPMEVQEATEAPPAAPAVEAPAQPPPPEEWELMDIPDEWRPCPIVKVRQIPTLTDPEGLHIHSLQSINVLYPNFTQFLRDWLACGFTLYAHSSWSY